ncbi:MAG TPA: substrate-binding domain-containing protein [Burkholderiales bacterium]|nr:substrate-binding domain-containing protein [Burkholderiales bacterium]
MSDDAGMELWATNAFQSVLKPLGEPLLAAAGGALSIVYRSSNMILAEVAKGGRGDALIATRPALEELAAQRVVMADSITDLASVGLGIGVRAGAPRPDLSTPDAVRSALLAARSIVYSATGASAGYFLKMVNALGIASEVSAKAIVYAGGLVGDVVARGEAELGAQMVSEIVAVPGVVLAGPLPREFQSPTMFAAALFAHTRRAGYARAVVRLLASPQSRPVYEAAGMTPAALMR